MILPAMPRPKLQSTSEPSKTSPAQRRNFFKEREMDESGNPFNANNNIGFPNPKLTLCQKFPFDLAFRKAY